MMFLLKQFLALTGLTAMETMRRPLCVLLTASAVVSVALIPLVTVYQFGEKGRLARDSGLAVHFVIGLIVAAYAACSALTRELRDGTAAAALSKPVGRTLFFLAKFAGVAAIVLAFSACATVATLLAERVAERYVEFEASTLCVTDIRTGIALAGAPFLAYLLAGIVNYRSRRPFQSTAFGLMALLVGLALLSSALFDRMGRWAPFEFRVAWRIVPAGLLVTLGLLIFAALALGFSTRLNTITTLTLCGALFVTGLMSDYWFGKYAGDSVSALAAHRLVPNWQHFWVSDFLAGGGAVPAQYLARAGGYWLVCLTGILLLGVVSFRHTEVN
ncbi:MAG: hypothetical protein QME60_03320 [Verrucomicrobiota bacterium]|nr:hypothetical protein [Verrucomicrobiota bacterium]